jgi:hypothetical protein
LFFDLTGPLVTAGKNDVLLKYKNIHPDVRLFLKVHINRVNKQMYAVLKGKFYLFVFVCLEPLGVG